MVGNDKTEELEGVGPGAKSTRIDEGKAGAGPDFDPDARGEEGEDMLDVHAREQGMKIEKTDKEKPGGKGA